MAKKKSKRIIRTSALSKSEVQDVKCLASKQSDNRAPYADKSKRRHVFFEIFYK